MIADHAATVFGVGRVPLAPGTLASALALPLAWLAMHFGGPITVLVLSALTAALGAWACDVYASASRKDDPSECVIDEVAGQLLACVFAPPSLAGFAVAFLLFRLFDISKLWPISAAERLRGGLGIVADDMVAGLIAGLIVAVLATVGLV